jgi:hypothetical protein
MEVKPSLSRRFCFNAFTYANQNKKFAAFFTSNTGEGAEIRNKSAKMRCRPMI